MVRTLLGLESGHGERLRVHLTHGAKGTPRPRPRLQAQLRAPPPRASAGSPGPQGQVLLLAPSPAAGSTPAASALPPAPGSNPCSLPALSHLPQLPPARPRLHGSSPGSRRSVSRRGPQDGPLQAPPRPIPALTGRRRPRLQPRPQRALRWVAGGTRRRQRCSSFFVFRQWRPRGSSTACPLGPPAPTLR